MLKLDKRLEMAMVHCIDITVSARDATAIAGMMVALRKIAEDEKATRASRVRAMQALRYVDGIDG
jgi:hypothetical protein